MLPFLFLLRTIARIPIHNCLQSIACVINKDMQGIINISADYGPVQLGILIIIMNTGHCHIHATTTMTVHHQTEDIPKLVDMDAMHDED